MLHIKPNKYTDNTNNAINNKFYNFYTNNNKHYKKQENTKIYYKQNKYNCYDIADNSNNNNNKHKLCKSYKNPLYFNGLKGTLQSRKRIF